MSQNPRVSVVIPSYNRAHLSLRAIASVVNQTYKNIEIIFVNDGSSEDYSEVEEVLSKLEAKYYKTPNLGVSKARNLGIDNSSGDYIAFLDSDDEWLEEKISKQVDFFLKNHDFKIVQTLERWLRNEKILSVPQRLKPAQGESFEKALEYCCIGPSSVLIRRDVFSEVGYFDSNLRICEDYDLWVRILDRHPVFCIQEELNIKYGGHPDQLSYSEKALDRFRVYSLVKYLKSALDQKKIDLVISALEKKLGFLEKGARKRNLLLEATRYLEMEKFLNSFKLNKEKNSLEELCKLSVSTLDLQRSGVN